MHELHLCGGTTPADVVMYQAWDATPRQRMQPVAQVGACVRVTLCTVVPHTEKTIPWTTSRMPVFLRATKDSDIVAIEDRPEWPRLHPTTSVDALQYLPAKALVCVAGRVVPPEPKVAHVATDDGGADVGNASIRNGSDLIRLSFWRESAHQVDSLSLGQIIYISCIGKHKVSRAENGVELRSHSLTEITTCPEPLFSEINMATPQGIDGARIWTPAPTTRRDWEQEDAEWATLSVCEAICAPAVGRTVPQLYQVPSLLVQFQIGEVVYYGCSQCKKAWALEAVPPCACAAQRTPQWKAKLTLTDSTAQVFATCFDAFGALAHVYAAGDANKQSIDYYTNGLENQEDLLLSIAAMPFTARISLEENEWAAKTEMFVRLLSPTFDEATGVKHPLKQLTHFVSGSYPCPPCKLKNVTFNEGVGLAVAFGGTLSSFRVLLEVQDQGRGARRGQDATTLRVERTCACALRASDDATTHTITQNAELEVVTRLLQVPQGAYIHATVAFRTAGKLSLLTFWHVPNVEVTKFRTFFDTEANLYEERVTGTAPPMTRSLAETPLRVADTASAVSSSTGRSSWHTRTPLRERAT